MTIRPVLKYPGSKWNLARRVLGLLPPHITYLEPFAGSLAVLLQKERSKVEVVNDLHSEIVNLFTVLRDTPEALIRAVDFTPYAREEFDAAYGGTTAMPVERARRYLVRSWFNHGAKQAGKGGWAHTTGKGGGTPPCRARHWAQLPDRIAAAVERLQGVNIEHRPALDVIARFNHPGCAIYADPPYPRSTRSGGLYVHEMSDQDHLDLLDALEAHSGPVVLSGYTCPLYDERLHGWERYEHRALAQKGKVTTEVIWRKR